MTGLKTIAETTIAEMPEPTPVADREMGVKREAESEAEKTQPILRDSKGSIFDPDFHATKAGKPAFNRDGTYKKKKGGKKTVASPPESVERQTALQAGQVTAQLTFAAGQAVFGEEWKPKVEPDKGINEPQQLGDAWAFYYEATGKTELPPWLVVLVANLSYSLPRLTMPKTQSRIKRFAAWITKKFAARRKKNRGPQSDSWNDRIG